MKQVVSSKERPVVILSTGRAGSTLLQKLLNTNEELLIWGEHEGVLNSLMNTWRMVSHSEWISDQDPRGSWLLESDRPLNVERWTAWDGSFSKQGFNQCMKTFVDSLFCKDVPENIRWGFKEIRYRKIEVMDFWSDLYPDTQYILLLRNPVDSCISFASARSQKDAATSEEELNKIMTHVVDNQIKPVFNFFREAMDKYADQSLSVVFEDLVEEPMKVLNGVEEFLDLGAWFDPENVSMIMGKDIVSQRKRTSRELKDKLREMALIMLADELDWFESFSGRYK